MASGIKGTKSLSAGDWTMDFAAVEVASGTCGERGTAKFTPNARAKDTNRLRLIQIVKTTTGGLNAPDYRWTGAEARRNQTMTQANHARSMGTIGGALAGAALGGLPGAIVGGIVGNAVGGAADVEGGYFVDHQAAAVTPRASATDAAVSPHYRDYWPNAGQSQDGSKQGATIRPASLWDFPSDSANGSFLFETVAKGEDNGVVYGTVKWQFTIENSKIKNENWTVQDSASATFGAALDKFNEVYKNPGASTAPTASPSGGTP